LNESWFNKEAFLSWNGMTECDWINMRFVNKLSDLLNYYGYENIFGSSYGDVFSTEEAIEWLNGFELK
jgi:succinate dehydrogenase flavin-adding protein (antitoxin of CptAB toxin-antitoxin module)